MTATFELMEPTTATKSCPRCGAILFADMDVCYGCLYDFSTSPFEPQDTLHSSWTHNASSNLKQADTTASLQASDLQGKRTPSRRPRVSEPSPQLYGANFENRADMQKASDAAYESSHEGKPVQDISFESLWTEEDSRQFDVGHGEQTEYKETTAAPFFSACENNAEKAQSSAEPAATKLSPDDTVDLGAVVALLQIPKLRVSIGGCTVVMELSEKGVIVGRHPSCDIIVSASSVSRKQLRLSRLGDAIYVEDLGATNPTIIHGMPLLMRERLGAGCSFQVGDAVFSIVQTTDNLSLV